MLEFQLRLWSVIVPGTVLMVPRHIPVVGDNVSERDYLDDKWALLTMKQVLIQRIEPRMQV